MFPAIAAIATLSALGISRWPTRLAVPLGVVIVAGLIASSTYPAAVLIPHSYLWS